MTSRDDVLTRVRAALTSDPAGTAPVPRRYQRNADTIQPEETIELLIDRLLDYKATVTRTTAVNLPATIDSALTGSRSVVIPVGLDPGVADACRQDGRVVTVDGQPHALTPAALDRIDVVVTAAKVAIAVSGTIILDGASDQGRRAITLVPDRHVVILHAHQVVTTVPEAIGVLDPVRPLTMIAGPSATSDIELERVEGVHGPRTLEVVIVG